MQDRVSLLPQVPVEVAYFWKDPAINRESLDELVDEPCVLCEVTNINIPTCYYLFSDHSYWMQ